MRNWVLVTGGAKRLGRSITLEVAKKGYPVIIHYHTSKDEAEHTAKECLQYGVAVELIQGSFSSVESTQSFIQNFLSRFDSVAHVINNVSVFYTGSLINMSEENWMQQMHINACVPFLLCRALIPYIKQQTGSIINIGTYGLHSLRADTFATAYQASKLVLWHMTKSLAKELAKDKIRVNMVSPGILENSTILPKDPSSILMGRLGHCEEVARVVAFLLDKDSSYITGQNIDVAGGIGL